MKERRVAALIQKFIILTKTENRLINRKRFGALSENALRMATSSMKFGALYDFSLTQQPMHFLHFAKGVNALGKVLFHTHFQEERP